MLVRRLARPMLASVFISEGIDTLRNPGPRAEMAEPVIDLITDAAQPVAEKVAATVVGAASGTAHLIDEIPAAPEPVAGAAHDVRSAAHEVAAGSPLPFETASYVKANAAVQ